MQTAQSAIWNRLSFEPRIVGRNALRELDCGLASSDEVLHEVIGQKCRCFWPQFLIIVES
jgi:hypothetical protein